MTHDELVNIALKYVVKKERCTFAFKELRTITSECADVIGFGSHKHSVLIECKISLSDFLRDKKKPFRQNPELGVGRYRYYAAPKGLIPIEKLPENWGLLEVNEKGKLERVHCPYTTLTGNMYSNGFPIINEKAERDILFSAIRRMKTSKLTHDVNAYP